MDNAPLTEAELALICHALGLPDSYERRHGAISYRNYFAAGARDEPTWRALEARGLAVSRVHPFVPEPVFYVTGAGIRLAGLGQYVDAEDMARADALKPAATALEARA